MMKENDLKVGDKVKIIDGSYALELKCLQYDDDMLSPTVDIGHIGLCRQDFMVDKIISKDGFPKSYTSGTSIYNIVITDTETGRRYLHSSSFVRLVKPTKIVKPLRELVNTLIDEGYKPDSDGDWLNFTNPIVYYECFCKEMFEYCGEIPPDDYEWSDSWLTDTENRNA